MEGERLVHDVLGRSLSPYLQSPGLFRRQVDRSVARAVEVDLKARSMNDDLGREIGDELFGERVFFPLAVRVGDTSTIGRPPTSTRCGSPCQ